MLILSVLKETRQLVLPYNEIYKTKVMATKGLKWLDFLNELLNETGIINKTIIIIIIHYYYSLSLSLLLDGDLKNHLNLDGTHVNPKYVTLLEKAFHNL